jgi:molybdate transport system substrate-binding protein
MDRCSNYRIRLPILLSILLMAFWVPVAQAESLKAAVAANFIVPFKVIATVFEKETDIKVDATFASTGSLYAQIINGAPYDVLLSADEEKPVELFRQGIGEKPFVYAVGRVVLWGKEKNFCGAKNWQDALEKKPLKKIAIPNPTVAPYGAAAESALKKTGLWNKVEKKLISAQNVGQAFQYAITGGTEACFCALSAALSEQGTQGCTYAVEQAPPITQAACLIRRTKKRNDAVRLLKFLNSPTAQALKVRYGYQ